MSYVGFSDIKITEIMDSLTKLYFKIMKDPYPVESEIIWQAGYGTDPKSSEKSDPDTKSSEKTDPDPKKINLWSATLTMAYLPYFAEHT